MTNDTEYYDLREDPNAMLNLWNLPEDAVAERSTLNKK